MINLRLYNLRNQQWEKYTITLKKHISIATFSENKILKQTFFLSL